MFMGETVDDFASAVQTPGTVIIFIREHAVIVDSVDTSSGVVHVRDPWGTRGPVQNERREVVNPGLTGVEGDIAWSQIIQYWRDGRYSYILIVEN
jgi:hypothetical protein